MPPPCSNDIPHIVADCLNLAQFVPSFVNRSNHCLRLSVAAWRFRGEGVAGLNQTRDRSGAGFRQTRGRTQDIVDVGFFDANERRLTKRPRRPFVRLALRAPRAPSDPGKRWRQQTGGRKVNAEHPPRPGACRSRGGVQHQHLQRQNIPPPRRAILWRKGFRLRPGRDGGHKPKPVTAPRDAQDAAFGGIVVKVKTQEDHPVQHVGRGFAMPDPRPCKTSWKSPARRGVRPRRSPGPGARGQPSWRRRSC